MKHTVSTILSVIFFTNLLMSQQTEGKYSCEITTKFNYNYILHQPQKSNELKPLIVFLHGSGERGDDVQRVKIHGPLKYVQNHSIDAYILAPQCPENSMWEAESLYKLINKIVLENEIDTNRIYITGLSMGGWGTWNLLDAHPEMFAAAIPVCGFVDRVPMLDPCRLKNIPIRIFHGLLDDVVHPSESIEMYKRLKNCNTTVTLTIFDDANHDSWTRVYDNEDIYKWLLSQKKL